MPKPGDIVNLSCVVEEVVHTQGDIYNLRLLTADGSTRWLTSDLVEAVGGHIFEVEVPAEEIEASEEEGQAPKNNAETLPQEPETPAETHSGESVAPQPEETAPAQEAAPEVPPLPEPEPAQSEESPSLLPDSSLPDSSEGTP